MAEAKPLTKTDIYNHIAEQTGLSRKQVAGVFDALNGIIAKELTKGKKSESKQFTIPGLFKITTKYKPATKDRPGKNPFTGEATVIKAKPASQQLKVRPLKGLKDLVN